MRIDYIHLLDNEIREFQNLDEVAEIRYPTGCVDLTKKEILAKLCEIEFMLTGNWSHEFLDELELSYKNMNASQLGSELVKRLQDIYDWNEDAYYRILG